jgi:non-heme chloroperoxidase
MLLHALVRLGETERAEQALAGLDGQERERGELRIATAALRLAQDDPAAATAALAPVLDGSAPLGRQTWLTHAFVLEAIARDAAGDPAAAAGGLERALDLAERDGALLVFVLFPAPGLLERHARQHTTHAALLASICSLLAGDKPAPPLAGPQPLYDPPSDSELAALTARLDLRDAIHVGHSTGGGEVVRYLARHGEDRVAKAVLISAVPPLMLQTDANPGGLPKAVFDGWQDQVATNRTGFYRDLPAGPFYGYNRPGAQASEAIIDAWWRQGMMGGAKAHYDSIVAFSQTDFTGGLRQITVPVLVMHGDDDQVVPYADCGPLTAKLVKNGTLKTYHGYPHGMPTTHADVINADLLAWLQA